MAGTMTSDHSKSGEKRTRAPASHLILRSGKTYAFNNGEGESMQGKLLATVKSGGKAFYLMDFDGRYERIEANMRPTFRDKEGNAWVIVPPKKAKQYQKYEMPEDVREMMEREMAAFKTAAVALFKKMKKADVPRYTVPIDGDIFAIIGTRPGRQKAGEPEEVTSDD